MKFTFLFNIPVIRNFFFFILFNCIWIYPAYEQQKMFSPAAEDEMLLQTNLKTLEKRYRKDIADLPSENKKDIIKIYQQRWENLEDKFDKKEIYTNEQAQQYLNSIVAEIVNANPLLQHKDISCFFSRSGIPNAEYDGEGLIVFNMGLFSRLDNESQFAFILCHELAHYYLMHSEKSIQKYVAAINSPEVQKELRSIKKTEYGKRQELEN